ncbi:MAG: tetratricopeptide repeat protein [Acidobacteriota bacterium]|nr:MAG: tetratricopeptide repeat protein [Acidobacteriota bacterium]
MKARFRIRSVVSISLTMLFVLGIRGQSSEEFQTQVARLMADFRWEEALQLAETGLDVYPSDTRLNLALAALYLQSGQTSRSLNTIQRAVSRNPSDPEILRLFGELQMAAGQWDSAERVLVRALRLGPNDGITYSRLAQIAAHFGDDAKAAELMSQAVERIPENADLRRFYSYLLDRLGKPDEAFTELKKGRTLDPKDARILLRLADKEKLAGHPNQAIEYLDLASGADPENPLFYQELAELYHQTGQLSEGEAMRVKAERLRLAFERYAETFSQVASGEVDEAVKGLELVWAENPEFLTGAIALADLYKRVGREPEALALYEEVLARDPNRDSIREYAAWLKADAGDIDSAIDLLYGAESVSPNAYLLRGYQLQLESDWDGALEQFQLASREYPLDPGILRQISLCLNSMGRVREALASLEKAHTARPGDPRVIEQARAVRFEYALGLENQGNWEEALKVLARLVLEEEKAEFLLHKAYCEQNLFQYEEAVRDYLSGLELHPEADWARINLTTSLYALGRYDDAARQWEFLVEKSDRPDYVYQLGLSRIRQWKLTEGWSLVRKAANRGWEPARQLLKRSGQEVPVP